MFISCLFLISLLLSLYHVLGGEDVPIPPPPVPMLSLKLTMQDRGVTAAVAGEATYGTHGAPFRNHFFSFQKYCSMSFTDMLEVWTSDTCTLLDAPGGFHQHNDSERAESQLSLNRHEICPGTDSKNMPQDGAKKAIGGNTEIFK